MAERSHALAVPRRMQRHLLGVPHIATGLLPVQVRTLFLSPLVPDLDLPRAGVPI